MSPTPYLSVLAPELLHLIAKYLGPPSLNRLIQTNTRFYDIFNDQLWAVILKSANQHGLVTSIFNDAARMGNIPLMLKLDEILGVDDRVKECSLKLAAESGCICAVEYLVNSHSNVGELRGSVHLQDALESAIRGRHVEPVRTLLSYGPSAMAVKLMLAQALKKAYGEIARELFEEFRKTNDTSSFNLFTKFQLRHTVAELLECAVSGDDPALVRMVLQCRPNINESTHYDRTPLYDALRDGKLEAARVLVEEGCDIKDICSGTSALTVARSADAVRLLFEHGASLDTINWTATSSSNPLDLLELLTEYGADIKIVHRDPTQLLICAAQRGLERYVPYLLEHCADIHGTTGRDYKRGTDENWTPLHYAADRGHVSTAQRLLESGAQVDYQKNKSVHTPLNLAAASGNRQMVDLLLNHGANAKASVSEAPTTQPRIFNWQMSLGCKLTSFHLAAYGGSREVLDILQSRVLNPPKISGSHIACSLIPQILEGNRRNGTMTKFLLESFVAGKKKRKSRWNLSEVARDVIRWLQVQDPSMRTVMKQVVLSTLSGIMGEQPYRDAILLQAMANSRAGNMEGFLTTASQSAGMSDYFGVTALVQAAREGDAATAKILLDNGVSANVKGLYNSTPLDTAVTHVLSPCLAREEAFQTIKLLVEYGADVSELPKELHAPSFNPHLRNGNAVKLAKLLLEMGVNPNSMDVSGRTPLHVATSNSNYRLIVTLLDRGADPDIRDNTGRKAMAEMEDLEPWCGWDDLHS